jgi:hypothetical protein
MATERTSSELGKGRGVTQAKKVARKKTSRGAKAKVAVPVVTRSHFSDDEWYQMVATAAYYRAQARGFEGGMPELDWYEAEEELEEQLSRD